MKQKTVIHNIPFPLAISYKKKENNNGFTAVSGYMYNTIVITAMTVQWY